jgi:hypothetical protein
MDIVATRSNDNTEAYKTAGTCWTGSFTTEEGGEVEVRMETVSQDPTGLGALGPAKIYIEVTYLDKRNFFNGEQRLYPYISVLKTKYLNQGAPTVTVDGGMRTMDRDSGGLYRATFSSALDNSAPLHQEVLAGITMAFTSMFPHSGQAPWDSNGHRNHGFWIR